MKSILDYTHNILSANRKQVNSILMKAKIASKALELNIPKPTNAIITTSNNNKAKSASLNSKVPYYVVATDFAGPKSKYASSSTKLKSANIEESPAAYLTIREFQKTGGVKEEPRVKSAAKRDPTAFITIANYLNNKRDYIFKFEELQEQQKLKSASKKKSNKPAYLVTHEYLFKGATD